MYKLDILNRLSEINNDKDITSLSHAIFPGTHCPLFGVALTASYINNLALVVVGTSECTYYTKNFAYHRQHGRDKVYSLALDEKDVVFGAQNKVEKAIKDIIQIENPEAIMIVTTCVPELIGEDYSSIEFSLQNEIDIPVFVVNTEHFKCNSHIPGMSRALKSLSSVMENSKVKDGVNILGHRQKNVENTELVKILNENNVKINTVIPSKCSIDDIKSCTKSKLNIVTDMIALDLAETMKSKFDMDYIYFDKHMDKSTIKENYKKLSKILNINIENILEEQEKEYDILFEECKNILQGKKIIYGNTPMMALETVDFLNELGLEPVFIQLRELYDQDNKFRENLLDIYIGHENPILLKEKGLTQITFDTHAQKIGYELPIAMMKELKKLFSLEKMSMGGMIYAAM